MSAFRIKKIDTGIIDEWVFRINDAGVILGDDVVAEDPNELAQAVTDTQDLIVRTGTYSPGTLIDPAEGVLSRIKTIETTFGTTTLQDAYNNGRFIAVAAGLPLSLGAVGEIELDSSGNLKINPNTFKITNNIKDMFLTEDGITSSNNSLLFSTTSGTEDLSLTSNRDLLLQDVNLFSAVALSESGSTSLITTAQSLVGAINEISGGFSSVSLQDIYDQSAPPIISTSLANGGVTIQNGSGNPSVAALTVDGGLNVTDFIDADSLTLGPGITVNLTMSETGNITTIGDITTSTVVNSPRVENSTGELFFLDSRGSANLTEIGQGTLLTTSQSIFGAINEVNTLAENNAASVTALDIEHDLITGAHEIINTQSGVGDEATSRFNIKDSGGITRISMNANGHIVAQTMDLDIYDVNSELAANAAHRANDGTAHTAFAAHIAAANPHNTVKSVAKFGDTLLNGDVTISEGPGVTITRSGQDLQIAAAAGATLQGVYDTQVSGDLNLNTGSGKHLFFKDSSSTLIMALKDTRLEINKAVQMTNVGASIGAVADLIISPLTNLTLGSNTGDVNINATTVGQTTFIEGVPHTDGSAVSLDDSVQGDTVGAVNDLAANHYTNATNATGSLQLKGTAVVLRKDGSFWIPYPDVLEVNAFLRPPAALGSYVMTGEAYWHAIGVLDEDVSAGATGRIRTSGVISADVGTYSPSIVWGKNDTLFISRLGFSEVDISSVGLMSSGDTLTFDTAGAAKTYTARASGAVAASGEFDISGTADLDIKADETRDNLINTLNNETYMAAGSPFHVQAFVAGDVAKARARCTGAGSPGDTFVLTPTGGLSGAAIITLTAVSNGTTPAWLEYELGLSAAETATYLAEAINRTNGFDGPDFGIAGDGHTCFADVYGDSLEIRWLGPGARGNNISLSSTGGNITQDASLTGGTAKVHVFLAKRGANGLLCSASSSGMTIANFTDDEGNSQFINQIVWSDSDRVRKDDDRRIKIGRVTEFLDPVVTFMVDVEEPRKNRVLRRGEVYDTEH